jgi:hypothetical protein
VIRGNVVKFQWRALNGATIKAPNSYYTTFEVYKIGNYLIELTGFDSSGQYGKDTIPIKVIR